MSPVPTPNLDRGAYEARLRHDGNAEAAAREMGISVSTLKDRDKRHKARLNQDPAVVAGMDAMGMQGVPEGGWVKSKPGRDGLSYSFRFKTNPLPDDTLQRIRVAFEGMQPAKVARPPKQIMDDLCTVYPLMDVHYGMHAWGKETGTDYDLKLANGDMRKAFAKVSALTPPSAESVLIIGGDFFHADDTKAETPAHKHNLDVDGRHFKVLDDGVEIISEVIDTLLYKHSKLTVRVMRGNHDEHSHLVLTFALGQRYRSEPRVDIEKNPRDLFMKQWGKVLISAHHGDRAPPERLTLYLSDVCPYWSETRHRYCFTGHVHKDQAKDVGPLRWESLRAFCPADAYAAGMGYAARRALQSITFHNVDGLVQRNMDPIER